HLCIWQSYVDLHYVVITEYTLSDIFNYVNKHESREFVLKFSALEIYNECVRDLLTF
ncbi:hypothetical protein Leryth_014707, partial [Lithospermum erythrorhizon]